jgi:hypothetical protein
VFGEPKKVLLILKEKFSVLFQEKQQRASIWGIELSRNRGNEIYVTAFRSVLGKDFTGEEVLRILD